MPAALLVIAPHTPALQVPELLHLLVVAAQTVPSALGCGVQTPLSHVGASWQVSPAPHTASASSIAQGPARSVSSRSGAARSGAPRSTPPSRPGPSVVRITLAAIAPLGRRATEVSP